jgi:hypothetical protein
VPVGHSPDWDFVAELEGRLLRVQVKTCTVFCDHRWHVTLCTRGGNRSWSGLVKRVDPACLDVLFVVVGDGRRWCVPADRLGGRSHIVLGGPKYAAYEVEPARPLPRRAGDDAASTIDRPPWGDARVAKGDAL